MFKRNDHIRVVANPHHRWENPFKRFQKGENRIYLCVSDPYRSRGEDWVDASILNIRGRVDGYRHQLRLSEIAPAKPVELDLDRFM